MIAGPRLARFTNSCNSCSNRRSISNIAPFKQCYPNLLRDRPVPWSIFASPVWLMLGLTPMQALETATREEFLG